MTLEIAWAACIGIAVGGLSTFIPFLIWMVADREEDGDDQKKDMKRELQRVRDDIEDESKQKTDNQIEAATYHDGLMKAVDIVDRRLARFEEGEKKNVFKHGRI